MYDEWVKDTKTGDCWRLDEDPSRPVYKKDGHVKFRDGLGTIFRYRFYPVCPKDAPVNKNIPQTGEQMTIFDFLNFSEAGPQDAAKRRESEGEASETDYEKTVRKYENRGYRPRIADALARKELGMENPDAFLLTKFNITGEDLNT